MSESAISMTITGTGWNIEMFNKGKWEKCYRVVPTAKYALKEFDRYKLSHPDQEFRIVSVYWHNVMVTTPFDEEEIRRIADET